MIGHSPSLSALLAVLAFATPGLPAALPADDESTAAAAAERRLDVLRAELVPRLVQVAERARRDKLFGERDRIWEAILAFDPDHAEARRGLRYHNFKQRGWVQSGSYHPGRNRPEGQSVGEALAAIEPLLAAAVAPYRHEVLLQSSADPAPRSRERRQQLLSDLLEVDPDDERVRELLGEARWRGRWVLVETARTLQRRSATQGLVVESLGVAPTPEPCLRGARELATGLFPGQGWATPRVQVFGTVPTEEVSEAARVAHALQDYFQLVFGTQQTLRPGYTLYLLKGAAQRDRVLAALPAEDEEAAALARQAAGGWLAHGQVYGEWDADPVRRKDGAARQAFGMLLRDAYGIEGRHGWAWEGLGLYLTYQLLGTRKTYFFHGSRYAVNRTTTLWWELQLPQTDWFDRGRALLASPQAPSLIRLIGQDVNSLSDEDLLTSYVLAAYLVEGRRDALGALLKRVGAGAHPVQAFEESLGLSLPELEIRLRRWVREVQSLHRELSLASSGR